MSDWNRFSAGEILFNQCTQSGRRPALREQHAATAHQQYVSLAVAHVYALREFSVVGILQAITGLVIWGLRFFEEQ